MNEQCITDLGEIQLLDKVYDRDWFINLCKQNEKELNLNTEEIWKKYLDGENSIIGIHPFAFLVYGIFNENPNVKFISAIAVSESQKRKGLGSKLINSLGNNVYVAVYPHNKIAYRMYEKCKFLEFGNLIDDKNRVMIALYKE